MGYTTVRSVLNEEPTKYLNLRPFAVMCLEGRKEMFYLTMHSTHFIYGYMASDIW